MKNLVVIVKRSSGGDMEKNILVRRNYAEGGAWQTIGEIKSISSCKIDVLHEGLIPIVFDENNRKTTLQVSFADGGRVLLDKDLKAGDYSEYKMIVSTISEEIDLYFTAKVIEVTLQGVSLGDVDLLLDEY